MSDNGKQQPARWPELFSDREAALYLSLSRSQVRQYIKAGFIRRKLLKHPSGVGYLNRLLIARTELDRFIKSDDCRKEKATS